MACLFAATAAAQDDAALDWRPVTGKGEPQRELIDCRSPIVAHEREVKPGEAWKFADHAFVFTLDGERLIVSHTAPGATTAVKSTVEPPSWYVIEAFGGSYALSLRLSADGKMVHASSATGLAIPVGTRSAYIVDSDMDGTLGSKGDGVVVPGSRTIGPLQQVMPIYSPVESIALRRHERDGWQMAELAMPRPKERDHSSAWRLLQWHRQASGLLPLKYDEALERGMKLHIDYLVRNNRYSHYQDPRLPGYSEEGARAGLASVIGKLKKSHVDGIGSQLTSLFHRSSCLGPELETSAMVLDRTHFMCSTKMHVQGPLRGSPLVYPAHGMTEVPCEFNIAGESPLPFEGEAANNRRGTAIGVRFAQLYYARSLPSPPTLTLAARPRGGQWHEVKCDLYYPGQTPRSAGVPGSYLGHVAVIPKQFLAPRTLHRARVVMVLPKSAATQGEAKVFAYEWEFTTEEAGR
ncbi:MAG: hypothetical protein WD768_05505 [Phycisphaeraceae bacterium]